MSFDLEKEIGILEEDIKEEEIQLNDINKLYNQIPKNNLKKEKNIKSRIKSLNDISNIIIKIDNINKISNPIDKLSSITSLYQTESIPNPFLRKYIINQLITEELLKLIEESFLNIKYPIFQGKILMTIFDQLNNDNIQDIEIISKYLQLYSILVTDLYKEFPNLNGVHDLIKKNKEDDYTNKFKFIEILPEFLFKKILTTIFDNKKNKNINEIKKEEEHGYLNKLNSNDKNILNIYEKLILYINKTISNTSELISLISSQINNEKKEFKINKNIIIKFLINNLFEKLILFSISEKSSLEINNSSRLLIILFIHRTSEQMNEFNKNYQYDSLKNISFYDFIKYYTSNTPKEKEIITVQKKFVDKIIDKLKKDLLNEKNMESNQTEKILENITLMIKDIISLFEAFRTFGIIDKLLIETCKNILNIFKDIYKIKIDVLYNQKTISIQNFLFTTNLLYNFSIVSKTEFEIFIDRIILYDESFKSQISKPLMSFNKELNDLFKDFQIALLSKMRFEKIFQLFNYNNLKNGNDSEEIKKTFNEENKFWSNIITTFDNIKANKDLIQSIMNEVTKSFIKELSLIVLNNIEKSDIEGKNLDVLIDKTKFFVENNFMNEDNIDEENKKNILKLYSYLDNLYMNKK